MICRDFGWQPNRLANKPQGVIIALDRIFKGHKNTIRTNVDKYLGGGGGWNSRIFCYVVDFKKAWEGAGKEGTHEENKECRSGEITNMRQGGVKLLCKLWRK